MYILCVNSGSAARIVLIITSSIEQNTLSHFSLPSRVDNHWRNAVNDHLNPSISGEEWGFRSEDDDEVCWEFKTEKERK